MADSSIWFAMFEEQLAMQGGWDGSILIDSLMRPASLYDITGFFFVLQRLVLRTFG
jgi:hypothetical protein